MTFQFDGFCFAWEGQIGKEERYELRVGVRRGSQLQLCLKHGWRNGNIKLCVYDNGWMDVLDENYQCYDTKVMIRRQF